MENYANGFEPETLVTIVLRLLMIGGLLATGIYLIKHGFNAQEEND